MTIRAIFIRQTDFARLYRFADNTLSWIPRSVVRSTVKFSSTNPLEMPVDKPIQEEVHELVIEDWWWDKHMEQGFLGEDQE